MEESHIAVLLGLQSPRTLYPETVVELEELALKAKEGELTKAECLAVQRQVAARDIRLSLDAGIQDCLAALLALERTEEWNYVSDRKTPLASLIHRDVTKHIDTMTRQINETFQGNPQLRANLVGYMTRQVQSALECVPAALQCAERNQIMIVSYGHYVLLVGPSNQGPWHLPETFPEIRRIVGTAYEGLYGVGQDSPPVECCGRYDIFRGGVLNVFTAQWDLKAELFHQGLAQQPMPWGEVWVRTIDMNFAQDVESITDPALRIAIYHYLNK